MKPSRMQYFLARDWPVNVLLGMLTILIPAAAIVSLGSPEPSLFTQGSYLIWFVLIVFVLMALLAGFLCALIIAWPIVGIISGLQAELNGAPFHVGDRVRILVGPHRDRVVEVYEVWDERRQVRVELGEVERNQVEDVFSFGSVCREAGSE
ncbi:MAG: hypothetical protein ACE5MG_13695 [Candidatus Methylomirabilales bacterium]